MFDKGQLEYWWCTATMKTKNRRAAKFAEPEIALARKAAELMKLSVFETDAPKIRRKLKKLPSRQRLRQRLGLCAKRSAQPVR